MTSVVDLRGVTKRFPGVVALKDIDVDLRENEVLGLIGQNGSGKSTLMKIMAGIVRPDTGTIQVRGKSVKFVSPRQAGKHGIGLVHQEQSLVPNLTIAENIFLDKATDFQRGGLYRWSRLNEAARRQLAKVELDVRPDTPVENLTFAERQMVELAKVLAMEELIAGQLVILFDEPTSVLVPTEIRSLFRQIRGLRQRASIVFISHRMDEVLEISDRVYVLSDGEKVAERHPGDTDPDELYELMVGGQRAGAVERDRRAVAASQPRVVMSNVSVAGRIQNVDLTVRRGEIVGMVGAQGSGAEDLCRTLFGIHDRVEGTIEFCGKRVVFRSPSDAVRAGIGYMPAERKAEGILRGRTVVENVVLTFGTDYGRGRTLISRARERAETTKWMHRLRVKTPSIDVRIEALSGGNQQKVILSKWLLGPNLKLLILDHPTRGLDPGARVDLFEAICALADDGLSILFVADTLDEVLTLSDSIVVMRDGRVSARFTEVQRNRPHEEALVKAMV